MTICGGLFSGRGEPGEPLVLLKLVGDGLHCDRAHPNQADGPYDDKPTFNPLYDPIRSRPVHRASSPSEGRAGAIPIASANDQGSPSGVGDGDVDSSKPAVVCRVGGDMTKRVAVTNIACNCWQDIFDFVHVTWEE